MRKSAVMIQKEAANMAALIERYQGKKDLLDTWKESQVDDRSYINDLSRRVRGHHNDILYRGGDFEEPQNNRNHQQERETNHAV